MGLTPPFGLAAGSRVTVDSAPLIYFLESHPVYAPKFAQVFEANATGLFEIHVSWELQ